MPFTFRTVPLEAELQQQPSCVSKETKKIAIIIIITTIMIKIMIVIIIYFYRLIIIITWIGSIWHPYVFTVIIIMIKE